MLPPMFIDMQSDTSLLSEPFASGCAAGLAAFVGFVASGKAALPLLSTTDVKGSWLTMKEPKGLWLLLSVGRVSSGPCFFFGALFSESATCLPCSGCESGCFDSCFDSNLIHLNVFHQNHPVRITAIVCLVRGLARTFGSVLLHQEVFILKYTPWKWARIAKRSPSFVLGRYTPFCLVPAHSARRQVRCGMVPSPSLDTFWEIKK
jgi:hypothetical protein